MRKMIVLTGLVAIASSAAAIEPGEWRATTNLADIALPDTVPAQVADMMRAQMAQGIETTQCITQRELDEAPDRVFRQSDGECRYTRFDMSGGKLDAVGECTMDDGTMTLTLTGTHDDTTYDMRMEMRGDVGMGPMTMTYRTTGERIGECG